METPSSSTRRVTRSQTFAAANNSDNVSAQQRIEESGKGSAKSRQRNMNLQDRSALIDITNDSPIVGLAMRKLETPTSSLMSKKRVITRGSTPGSGEALLRGQVKTLLQKVEEEAEFSKSSSAPRRPLPHLQGHVFDSAISLLAPTPASTPQIISNPSGTQTEINSTGLASILESSQAENEISVPQVEESSEKDLMITRSLLLDFSEKSEGSFSSECSFVATYQGGERGNVKDKAISEDDDSSIWSIQVSEDSKDLQETDEELKEEGDKNDYYFEEEEEKDEEEIGDAGLVDELCDAISKINVNENGQARFCGKHIKFVYNSDDEFEGEEVVSSENESSDSSGALKLHGWPSPKGKHVRFPEAFDD